MKLILSFTVLLSLHLLIPATPVSAQGFNVPVELQDLIEKKQYAEAEALASKMENIDPHLIAWLRLKQGNSAASQQLLKDQVAQASQTNKADAILHSIAITADGDVDAAIQMAEDYLSDEQWKEEPRIQITLANLYLKKHKPNLAVPIIENIYKTNYAESPLKDGTYRLIIYLYQKDQPQVAFQFMEKLFERFPETRLDPGYQMQWCHISTAIGRPNEALIKLDQLQNNFPDYYAQNVGLFHMAKAIAYESLGDREHSKTEWQSITNLAAQNSKFESMAGMARDKLLEIAQFDDIRKKVAAKEAPKPSKIPLFTLGGFLVISAGLFFYFFRFQRKARVNAS